MMSSSRVSQFFKNVFGRNFDRKERAYVPVPTYGIIEGSSSEETNRGETVQQLPPKDNYRIVYLIFLLQGVAMLLGWNGIA